MGPVRATKELSQHRVSPSPRFPFPFGHCALEIAERLGLPAGEARRLASAFEHDDQEYARGIAV